MHIWLWRDTKVKREGIPDYYNLQDVHEWMVDVKEKSLDREV